MNLTGNTVLVTGATAGIGLAITEALLTQGNTVLAVGRNTQLLEHLAQPTLIPIACDLSDATQLHALVHTVTTEYPQCNMVVNNAGVQYNYELPTTSACAPRIERELMLNLEVPITLTAYLLPVLMQQSTAAIINITSALAIAPKRSAAVYCATKAGLKSFTKSLTYQLSHTNVQVFEVVPPLVDTGMTRKNKGKKISPEALVKEMLQGLKNDRPVIHIGKAKLLKVLHRISPGLVERIMRNN
ncbi:putative oxidoreductase [Chitinophaga skermanii]|uniref:Putative oxidoreductase n=1 Tax=Chitinophaga skermanii TaxID=331697 RepID=A0A327QY71_9BACT|nr:SDR family NAD(P)-dependent oxidoreductase [Chitinophaga skermanii]RAJ08562.1 putative oxidoreductase [Chitinophaga skermanii]